MILRPVSPGIISSPNAIPSPIGKDNKKKRTNQLKENIVSPKPYVASEEMQDKEFSSSFSKNNSPID